MGVQFNDLIPKKEISLKDLKNKTVAIDSMNILYQFLSSIRLRDGSPLRNSKGEITSTYNGIFYKNIYMLENDITPIWVFDGKPPELKHKTREERKKVKEKAMEEYISAKEEGNLEDMQKYAKRINYLEPKVVENSKRLLNLMGIPFINAPSEGEAQCSYMAKKGDVYAVVSQDYDALLYGAPRTVRNITASNKPLELIELDEVLGALNITLDNLIDMAILIGTDYNIGGVKGIGPKKALDIVKNNKMGEYIKNIENYEVIKNIFKHPKVTDEYSLKLGAPNIEELRKFLIDENNFSENRILPSLKKLEKIVNKKKSQTTIESWF
ncbi:flap endonuclease-1 [Methanothermococcus okinawensis]|uniref:Flap endonuclease 1 n=1 Tax=Methanothermococcus okinawensis (strain DSM 14208 / JCM 11175 / IH1) TaxID=647113 RepID=F8AJL5_METOI|nr:flap endonuclease-1 [Methanothermococcus okinawensis]AEH07201.1 Flap structure-specific endonuclease [Methanothermococcus okinawensis IH1]